MGRRRSRMNRSRDSLVGHWLDRFDAAEVVAARGLLLRGGLAMVLLVGAAVGLRWLEQRVVAPMPDRSPRVIQWVGLPTWLQAPANRHIVDRLSQACGLSAEDRLLDPHLAERVARRLEDPALAWIAKVHRVELRPDGTVSVACEFREPIAWVRHNGACYLLSSDGVRLPGEYSPARVTDPGLTLLDGVLTEAPPAGYEWLGADVDAGLRVLREISARSFRHQVRRVLVDNVRGRRNPQRPQIELETDSPTARIGWGRPPGEEDGMEISAEQKLALLESMFRQSGRIDMNRPYVNITMWPDRVAARVAEPIELPRLAQRG